MELTQYLRALRAHWRLLAASVVVCVAFAGVITATQASRYEARATLFVASGGGQRGQAYEGSLLAQQRARSYAELVPSRRVADAVAADVGSGLAAGDVQRRLEAVVPVDTVLIEVTATSPTPREAQALAASAATELPRLVQELETAAGEAPPPVSLRVAASPALPRDPVSPRPAVNLALGLLLGLVLGVGAVMLRAALDDRVRTAGQAAAAARAPVLADVAGADSAHFRRVWSRLPIDARRGPTRLLVTSVGAEGAATRAALGVGAACAEAGRSVVVVDANLARPSLADLLDISGTPGLAGALTGDVPLDLALHSSEPGLPMDVLPAGAAVQPASDVLAAPRCAELLDELSARADVVIVATAPVDAAADAAVLARLMSAAVLVTPLQDTRGPQLAAAARELATAGARLLGLVTIPPALRRARNRGTPSAAVPAAARHAGDPAGARTEGAR